MVLFYCNLFLLLVFFTLNFSDVFEKQRKLAHVKKKNAVDGKKTKFGVKEKLSLLLVGMVVIRILFNDMDFKYKNIAYTNISFRFLFPCIHYIYFEQGLMYIFGEDQKIQW